VHWKQGGVSLAPHCERSQTPSGPAGSWHCTPNSVHVSCGPPDDRPESQAIKPSSAPSTTARPAIPELKPHADGGIANAAKDSNPKPSRTHRITNPFPEQFLSARKVSHECVDLWE